MKTFWLCFVPIFVAVDAIGTLPIYIGLSSSLPRRKRPLVVLEAVITALTVALLFVFAGSWLMRMIGVSVADFMIAGGVLLFVIAMSDLLGPEKRRKKSDPEDFGAVPLGVPLIAGPASLTTALVLKDHYSSLTVASALSANIVLAGVLFYFADPIHRFLGKNGAKVVSKIASLFLAAIAVMLMRKGVISILESVAR